MKLICRKKDALDDVILSKELLLALKESEDIINNPDKYKSYKNIEELKDGLLSED